MSYSKKALSQYNAVALKTAVSEASPHELVTMLFDGVLTAVTRAKGLIEQKQMEAKGEQINKASRILLYLKGSLDHAVGGELASNLESLYDYMLNRLVQANRDRDVAILDEIRALVIEIKSGWEDMPEDFKQKKG